MSSVENKPSAASEGSAQKTVTKEPSRTVEFWRKRLPLGIDRRVFEMVVFEHKLEERDRLTKSQLDFYMNRRKDKTIG